MLVHAAEESFQKGLDLLARGRNREALAFFRGAVEIEQRISGEAPQARYVSYYGLALGLTGGSLHEAVSCCRMAARSEGYHPDVCLNLGRVLLLANRKREAHKTLERGRRAHPEHKGLRDELRRMGWRRRPVVPFLARDSRINVLLGRLRYQAEASRR